MNKYALIAISAANYTKDGYSPESAWEKASCEIYPKGTPAQTKGCSKHAFLGLFSKNDKNSKNAQYARKAVLYLHAHKNENISPMSLWKIVMNGEEKKHNSQMDVVLALWKKGLID